jgi:hypothetical protein
MSFLQSVLTERGFQTGKGKYGRTRAAIPPSKFLGLGQLWELKPQIVEKTDQFLIYLWLRRFQAWGILLLPESWRRMYPRLGGDFESSAFSASILIKKKETKKVTQTTDKGPPREKKKEINNKEPIFIICV